MNVGEYALPTAIRRRVALLLAVALFVPAMLVVAAQPAEAHHLCAVYANRNHTNGPYTAGGTTYWMGTYVAKAAWGDHRCRDVNVSWTNLSRYHRGRYWSSSAGSWFWNSSGAVWIASGTQSPWKVIMTSVVATTPVMVGNTTRHTSSTTSRSTWRV